MKLRLSQHIISWNDLMKIVRKLKTKEAQKLGYSWEVEDLNMDVWNRRIDNRFKETMKLADTSHVRRHGDYPGGTPGFYLQVFRDVEPKA